VGLTSDEQEFTTAASQIKKPTDKTNIQIIQTWGRIARKLQQWVGEHEKIAIGSFNKSRTAKYRRILQNFGLDVSEIYEQSQGDFFFIYKK
jgi:transketolase